MRGIHINGHKEDSKGSFQVFHKPSYIYIPLILGNDTDLTVLVKKNTYVCKGEVIARKKGPMTLPIHSSVSGMVIDFEDQLYHDGQLVKCIKIENDFKERQEESHEFTQDISKFTKEQFIEIVKNAGIIGMGGAGFPTYIKYQSEQIKTLIVNAVECEPFITADASLLKEKSREILETIDAIIEIFKLEECIIAVKKNNTEVIRVLQNFLGTYLRIRIVSVPNLYPMGWERSLVHYCKGVTYKNIPIERGIVVNNVSTIYAIKEALHHQKPLIERVVTFTGDMMKQPMNVLVKTGTKASEVISSVIGMKRAKDIVFVAGGPMMGTSLPSDEVILTPDVNCIMAFRFQENLPSETCMRCGKCVQVCPAKIAPVLIKDAYLEKEALRSLTPEKCIRCGLCSYICPAKIEVREFVKKANERIRGE